MKVLIRTLEQHLLEQNYLHLLSIKMTYVVFGVADTSHGRDSGHVTAGGNGTQTLNKSISKN
jgi:hypothetical protein